MPVELDGNVRMRGDTGPGVGVKVLVEKGRLRLFSGDELLGDWVVADIGVSALQDGFNIRAEGEEFILRTEDDVAFADELGLSVASPRLARRIAARHNPDEPEPAAEPGLASPHLAAIGFALAGALVVLGGTFLSLPGSTDATSLSSSSEGSGSDFWIAFVVGGILMIAVAYVMSIGARFGRAIAAIVLLAVIVVFGIAISQDLEGTRLLTAYGFIAGGLVVGVAVLAGGSLRQPD